MAQTAASRAKRTSLLPEQPPTRANRVRPLTQGDMVLISMARAAKNTTAKVPYEELVLQAWRDFPQAFSLRNHPEHPDASDIHKRIYQTLKPAGLVVALGNKVFRLTDSGIAEARVLLAAIEDQPSSAVKPTRLARDEQVFVERALSSRAFATWQSGEPDKLIDYDARMFFQFSTGTAMAERQLRRNFARDAINKAAAIGVDRADELSELADFLIEKFAYLFQEP